MTDNSGVPAVQPSTEPAVPAWLLVVYRTFAYITGVLLVTLTVALIVLWGTEPKPVWYSLAWTLHGWAYMGYLGSAFALSFMMRWSIGRTILVLLAGTVPAMSFVAERWVVHRVRVRDPHPADVKP
jgi:integral membrane protein